MELTQNHRDALQDVLQWRRDVRHFLPDPIDPATMGRLRAVMDLAPSVGNSRPWRVIEVASSALRTAIIANFETANQTAGEIYDADTQQD